MTHLSNGIVVTNIDAQENAALVAEGYTVRHIEDWHGHGSCIVVQKAHLCKSAR